MITLSQAAQRYLAAHQLPSTDRSIRYTRKGCLNIFLGGIDGDRPMAEFSAEVITAELEHLRVRRHISTGSMHNYTNAVKHFLRWCVEEKLIPDNDYIYRRREHKAEPARAKAAEVKVDINDCLIGSGNNHINGKHATIIIALKYSMEFFIEELERILSELHIKAPRKKKGT